MPESSAPISIRTVSVDRIESDIAVLVTETVVVEIPAAWLPPEAGEGTVLHLALAPSSVDTEKLAERIRILQGRQRSGDIEL